MKHEVPMGKEKDRREVLADARKALGLDHLVLLIHDASFPNRADEETGRGSPYSRGARDLLEWALDRGFTGVQLGPQGETSRSNPSPYDGTAFSKTVLSIALRRLADEPEWKGILPPSEVDAVVRGVPGTSERMHYAYVYDAYRTALETAFARVDRGGPLFARFEDWRDANASWVDRDARMESWAKRLGTDDWRRWPPLAALPDVGRGDDLYAFGQFVVHAQHASLVTWSEANGLRVFGDLAIGTSFVDRFARDELFLRHYLMGAPPSRTNPAGQPWAYPVFVPGSADALAFMRARARKLLSELHGLRIDHPHGHVCPWVYDARFPTSLAAVTGGARLHESPDLPDHPALCPYAIARADQIDRSVARYAEGWVTNLDDAQVERYASQLDVLVEAARELGRAHDDILCEVLSTCPYPLLRVMQRHGFGRFRVTQKANPLDEADVYRTDLAVRGDWVMLGNHDTAPIWCTIEEWSDKKVEAWSRYLSSRLAVGSIGRGEMAQAMFADLFLCDAGRIGVFFADLFGIREIYNKPGVTDEANWTLRIGNDFADTHAERVVRGEALDVLGAMASALEARGESALATALRHLDR